MDITLTMPTTESEPWRAKAELPAPFGEIVDEAGSGRSVVFGIGKDANGAVRDLMVNFGKSIIVGLSTRGVATLPVITAGHHAALWTRIKAYTVSCGGDPMSGSHDAAADINSLLAGDGEA